MLIQGMIAGLPLLLYYGFDGLLRRGTNRGRNMVLFNLTDKELSKKFPGTKIAASQLNITSTEALDRMELENKKLKAGLYSIEFDTRQMQRHAERAEQENKRLESGQARLKSIAEDRQIFQEDLPSQKEKESKGEPENTAEKKGKQEPDNTPDQKSSAPRTNRPPRLVVRSKPGSNVRKRQQLPPGRRQGPSL
ncbi:hypothetical protein HUT17_02330 [Nocardiopsis flavescens]|nr:hypothetical protein HUT17_02330 [Nocardiopsis flavescens]